MPPATTIFVPTSAPQPFARDTGNGGCGKGYKEWVRVSDGGPCLKVKVKLG